MAFVDSLTTFDDENKASQFVENPSYLEQKERPFQAKYNPDGTGAFKLKVRLHRAGCLDLPHLSHKFIDRLLARHPERVGL